MRYKRISIYNMPLSELWQMLEEWKKHRYSIYHIGAAVGHFMRQQNKIYYDDEKIREVYSHTAIGSYKNPTGIILSCTNFHSATFSKVSIGPKYLINRGFLIYHI